MDLRKINGTAKWLGAAFVLGGLIWSAASRVAIIETRLNSIDGRLERIEGKVDRLDGNRRTDRPLQKSLDTRPPLRYSPV